MWAPPKFLLATNKTEQLGIIYIYHSEMPRFLAKYVPQKEIDKFEMVDDIDKIDRFFSFNSKKRDALWAAMAYWYSEIQNQTFNTRTN